MQIKVVIGNSKARILGSREDAEACPSYSAGVRAEDRFRGSLEGLEKMAVASIKTGSVGLNEFVQTGTNRYEAIIQANRDRLRPILHWEFMWIPIICTIFVLANPSLQG